MRLEQIGTIRTPFAGPVGTPIQPAFAEEAPGTVEVFAPFTAGLADLEGFERIWLIYWFHKAGPVQLRVRPFMDEGERGLFATRAPCRPNPIGISCVRLLAIEHNILRVADVDMLDGTPLLDIKPYAPCFDCFGVQRIGWLAQADRGQTTADDRFSSHKGEKP